MTAFAEHPSSDTPDGLLVRAYLAGDDDAFDALFKRYYPNVRSFLYTKGNDWTLAEDLAQETMVRALRYLHTYDPSRPLWPWLRTIAVNIYTTERQRRASEVLVEEVDRGIAPAPDGSDEVVSRDAVIACLQRLPKRQRRALVMRFLEDRDSNDIADLFGIKRNALEQLILRAKQSFRQDWQAQNGTVLFPGFAALAARIRRIVTGFETRVNAAVGGTMSVAGDVALGAALTVGGITIVAAGLQPHADGTLDALHEATPVEHIITGAGAPIETRDLPRVAYRSTGYTAPGAAATQAAADGNVTRAEVAGPDGTDETSPETTTDPNVTGPQVEPPGDVPVNPPGFGGQRDPKTPDTPEGGAELHKGVAVGDTAGVSVTSGSEAGDDDGDSSFTNVTVTLFDQNREVEGSTYLAEDFCDLTACPVG